MADRTFASLVPRVQASVPGCPHATIVQYIRDSAIRTCERTLAWRYQAPLFNLQPGVSEYSYNKPKSADVHVVFEAVVNNRPLKRLTLEKAIELYPQWYELTIEQSLEQFPDTIWNQIPPLGVFDVSVYNEPLFNDQSVYPAFDSPDGVSAPQSILQVSPDKYIVLPPPDEKETYQCRMFLALKPKHTATAMNSAVFDELEEVIMHGALQHLLVLPNQAWSDRELAAYHAKQYAFQIAERRARANLGNMRGTMRVRMQPFGA